MSRPQQGITSLKSGVMLFFSCLLIFSAVSQTRAQQPPAPSSEETRRGMRAYTQGDLAVAEAEFRAAVKKSKEDASAWYYLGLTLARKGRMKDARKAIETAVKLLPQSAGAHSSLAYMLMLANKSEAALREAESALAIDARNAEAHYVIGVLMLRGHKFSKALKELDAALRLDPNFSLALLLKSHTLVSLYYGQVAFRDSESPQAYSERSKGANELLKQAVESLESYLKLNPSQAESWREQLETLRVYAYAKTPQGEAFSPHEVTTRARILRKAEPQYTDEARSAGISGTVILRAIFDATGEVKHILVLQTPGYGLTQQAVRAARRIKFVPATKDGRAVSQFIQIEYNFNLY
ncbi:MAG TPA: TonB family protein [Pyrinomonadaceae bacterium]